MFNLGGSEILVLAFLALILFGNKDLPSHMKKMVKGLNEAKKFANDAQQSWTEIRDDVTRQIMADDALEQAKKDLKELKASLEEPMASKKLGSGSGPKSSAEAMAAALVAEHQELDDDGYHDAHADHDADHHADHHSDDNSDNHSPANRAPLNTVERQSDWGGSAPSSLPTESPDLKDSGAGNGVNGHWGREPSSRDHGHHRGDEGHEDPSDELKTFSEKGPERDV